MQPRTDGFTDYRASWLYASHDPRLIWDMTRREQPIAHWTSAVPAHLFAMGKKDKGEVLWTRLAGFENSRVSEWQVNALLRAPASDLNLPKVAIDNRVAWPYSRITLPLRDGRKTRLTSVSFNEPQDEWLQSWDKSGVSSTPNLDSLLTLTERGAGFILSGSARGESASYDLGWPGQYAGRLEIVDCSWEESETRSAAKKLPLRTPRKWLMLRLLRKDLPDLVLTEAPFPKGATYAQEIKRLPSGNLLWVEFNGDGITYRLLDGKTAKQIGVGSRKSSQAELLVLYKGRYVPFEKARFDPRARDGIAIRESGRITAVQLVKM